MTDQPNKPTHRVCYSFTPVGSRKERTTEIGAAWVHRAGFSLSIDVPLNLQAGERLVMFEITQDELDMDGAQ